MHSILYPLSRLPEILLKPLYLTENAKYLKQGQAFKKNECVQAP